MTVAHRRRVGAALVSTVVLVGAGGASATYVDAPYGHFAVRDIVIVDHTGNAQMAAGAQHAADLWNAVGANFHVTVQQAVVSTEDAVCYDASVSGRVHLCLDPYAYSRGGYTEFIEFEPGYTQLGPATHFRANVVHMCGHVGPNCYDWASLPEGVNRVLPHEVGHALGLPHQSAPNPGDVCSVMATTGCYSEVPSQEDRETLIGLYGHSDGAPTSTSVPRTLATTTTLAPTTTSTLAATTTTVSATTTTSSTHGTTTASPVCAALAAQYAASTSAAQRAAIRQAQVRYSCAT